jgi:hypothetical protein
MCTHTHSCEVLFWTLILESEGAEENISTDVTGGWRKLHNEELHSLYSSPSIMIKEDEMDRVCSMNGGGEECI